MNSTEPMQRILAAIQRLRERSQSWTLLEWMPVSAVLQLLTILIIECLIWLWPASRDEAKSIQLTTDMSFVEFETETLPQARSRDLSDEVIAVDTLRDENQINWNNAVDPSFDFSQRYTAVLAINNANQENQKSFQEKSHSIPRIDTKSSRSPYGLSCPLIKTQGRY